jgi:DNA-binding response OmpR family regulator
MQFSIFKLLFNNIGTPVSKDILLDTLESQSDNALRVAINKLKHTLDIDIENVRGVGYIINKI